MILKNNIVKCLLSIQGYNGSHVYEETIYDDHLTLKIIIIIIGKKIFYLEYLLKKCYRYHEDIAGVYWTFIGKVR